MRSITLDSSTTSKTTLNSTSSTDPVRLYLQLGLSCSAEVIARFMVRPCVCVCVCVCVYVCVCCTPTIPSDSLDGNVAQIQIKPKTESEVNARARERKRETYRGPCIRAHQPCSAPRGRLTVVGKRSVSPRSDVARWRLASAYFRCEDHMDMYVERGMYPCK